MILLLCLVLWTLFKLSINSNKQKDNFLLSILQRAQSILNQFLDLRDSKSNSCYTLYLEVPLIAPVNGRQDLYWTDSSFHDKRNYRLDHSYQHNLTDALEMFYVNWENMVLVE